MEAARHADQDIGGGASNGARCQQPLHCRHRKGPQSGRRRSTGLCAWACLCLLRASGSVFAWLSLPLWSVRLLFLSERQHINLAARGAPGRSHRPYGGWWTGVANAATIKLPKQVQHDPMVETLSRLRGLMRPLGASLVGASPDASPRIKQNTVDPALHSRTW